MQPTSFSAVSPPVFRSDGAGNASRLTDPHIQTCSDRVLQALADYSSILEEAFESMSLAAPSNPQLRLRHGMARATTAIAIDQLVACPADSLPDLSVKQAALDECRAFCAENSWLGHLISESASRDLAHLPKQRKASSSWFPSVSIPSWSPRPWAKAHPPSEGDSPS